MRLAACFSQRARTLQRTRSSRRNLTCSFSQTLISFFVDPADGRNRPRSRPGCRFCRLGFSTRFARPGLLRTSVMMERVRGKSPCEGVRLDANCPSWLRRIPRFAALRVDCGLFRACLSRYRCRRSGHFRRRSGRRDIPAQPVPAAQIQKLQSALTPPGDHLALHEAEVVLPACPS